MKRTPMQRRTALRAKAPPPRPVKTIEGYTPRPRPVPRVAALICVSPEVFADLKRADTRARMVVPVPKRPAVRNKTLREAYRLIPCQFERDGGGLCARMDGTVCCCHSNWAEHGKGMARKADDSRGAAGCVACHTELDQGRRWGANEKRRRWQAAHERSVRLLVAAGLWPKDIPIPKNEANKEC